MPSRELLDAMDKGGEEEVTIECVRGLPVVCLVVIGLSLLLSAVHPLVGGPIVFGAMVYTVTKQIETGKKKYHKKLRDKL